MLTFPGVAYRCHFGLTVSEAFAAANVMTIDMMYIYTIGNGKPLLYSAKQITMTEQKGGTR